MFRRTSWTSRSIPTPWTSGPGFPRRTAATPTRVSVSRSTTSSKSCSSTATRTSRCSRRSRPPRPTVRSRSTTWNVLDASPSACATTSGSCSTAKPCPRTGPRRAARGDGRPGREPSHRGLEDLHARAGTGLVPRRPRRRRAPSRQRVPREGARDRPTDRVRAQGVERRQRLRVSRRHRSRRPAHPDIAFVVYHSGYEAGNREGPYSRNGRGVDRLVRSLADAGVEPGHNVYAELGSTWFNVMRDPDQAPTRSGSCSVPSGPTTCCGVPTRSGTALRKRRSTRSGPSRSPPEFQETYGYPALSAEIKTKILGANAARLYGVTPPTTTCRFTRSDLQEARQALASRPASYGPRTIRSARALAREHGWIGF